MPAPAAGTEALGGQRQCYLPESSASGCTPSPCARGRSITPAAETSGLPAVIADGLGNAREELPADTRGA